MNINEYIEKIKTIQVDLVRFIDNENDQEENYEILIENIFNIIKTIKQEISTILSMIGQISTYHHRYPNFFVKIEKILKILKKDIHENCSNFNLYKIFNNNKRIILFLLEEKMLQLDDIIVQDIRSKSDYSKYFKPEIEIYKGKENLTADAEFNEKRKIGENDNLICKLIQNDSIDKFISFINQNDFNLESNIESSIFETNPFLLEKNEISLIEYASFFGSIQIFKYLYKNDVKLTENLWIYAIHGENDEIIHILEENKVQLNDLTNVCFLECIKCYHNDDASYIEQNFIFGKSINMIVGLYGIKNYNFFYFPKRLHDDRLFLIACKFNLYIIAENY